MATDNYRPAVENTLKNLMAASKSPDKFPALKDLAAQPLPDLEA